MAWSPLMVTCCRHWGQRITTAATGGAARQRHRRQCGQRTGAGLGVAVAVVTGGLGWRAVWWWPAW